MRKTFKLNRICSSDNYKESKTTHKEILENNHNENIAYLNMIVSKPSKSSNKYKRAYTMWNGKEIEIPANIAKNMSSSINIIWK